MLGLLLLLITTISLAPIYAEPTSPLQQISNGIPSDMIQCSAGKILVQSQNAKPACVYEDTANKLETRGWKIIQTEPIIPLDIESDVLDDFVPEIITIKSPATTISEPSKIGDIGPSPRCFFQNEITLETPNRVRVGEVFNVTASFSFDKEDPRHDKKYWDAFCNKHISIRYPPNYEAMGDGLKQSRIFIHDHYKPPIVSHGMIISYIEYNQQPITFQMRINDLEDAVYDSGSDVSSASGYEYDLNMLSEDDMYDFGYFGVTRPTGNVSATAYTSINNGFVYLSDTEFPSGQDDDKPVKIDPQDWFPPMIKIMPHDPSRISYDVPFEWIAEELEGAFKGEDPVAFIKRFGLNQTYVDEFLEAYPEYKIKTQSSSLVKAIF